MTKLRGLVFVIALVPTVARAQSQLPGSQSIGAEQSERGRTIKPPKLVHFVEAPYPESAKASGKQASVTLQIAITEAGKVAVVQVMESAGQDFDDAAVAAAKQFVFEPAQVNGRPVPVKIAYRYEFVIREEIKQKTTADFGGQVLDRATKKPLAHVTVALDTGQSAITDDQGKFFIPDVAPGDHTVTLSGDSLTPVGTQETFVAAKRIDATYDVSLKTGKSEDDDSDFEVVVTAPRIQKQIVSTEVTAQQATRVPGTQGDVLKVVESMPGVARAAVGSGAIVVWGAAPEDTGVYVDGVRVPRLYHDGGYRSIIHSDLVKSVELVPGGFGAQYGRGLGGLINVQLRPLDDDRLHGSLSADIIDSAASMRGPIGDKVHFAVGVRKGYLKEGAEAVASPSVADVVPLPSFWDAQARIQFDLGKKRRSRSAASSRRTRRTARSSIPTRRKRRPKRRRSSSAARGRATRKCDDRNAVITVLPYYGRNESQLSDKFGPIPTTLGIKSDVYGFRASYRAAPTKQITINVGFDSEITSSAVHRQGSVTSPAREGDVHVFGQAPTDQVNVDDWNAVIGAFAPYVDADLALFGGRLHVAPGLRIEPYLISVSKTVPVSGDLPKVGAFTEDTALDPRLAARFDVTSRVLVKAAFGIYHQGPAPDDLSAVFGNPRLGTSSARHLLAGATFKLTKTTTFDVTGFYNTMDSLVARNTSPTPALAQALLQDGSGRTYGVQMLLRQEQLGPFFGWISYTISRSERQDAPGLPYRLFDYDQTHTLTAVASLDLGKGWEAGVRFRFSVGFPRTPVLGAYYDARSDSYQPIFGAKNTDRIPAFAQLDARIAKRFKIGKTEAEAYLDVQNVTNTENPEEIVYSFDYKQKAYITGLPILPVLGAKWSF